MIKKITIQMMVLFLGFPLAIEVSAANTTSSSGSSLDCDPVSYEINGKPKGEVSRKLNNRGQEGIPSELITGKSKKRNPALHISVESVMRKLRGKKEIILIDVRESKEFKKFSIPGSINIPLFAIKTKAFLKNKPLALVNEGYNSAKLEQECKRLRDFGFEIWIMTGGLNFWRQKGGPIVGDVFAQKELNKISPRSFFGERNFDDWLVIDASESRKPETRQLMPGGMHISFLPDSTRFASKLKKTADKHKSNAFLFVLIFNEDGRQYEKIEKIVDQTGIKNVFYLKDGLNGYEAFLQKHALVRQPGDNKKRTLKKNTRCQ